jgi:hypothetical protein
MAEFRKAKEAERSFLEPGIELCNKQIAEVEGSLSELAITGISYLWDYATDKTVLIAQMNW